MTERTKVNPAELGGAAGALLATGHRLALVAAHDDGPELRVVYVFLGAGSRRAEVHVRLPADRPRLPSLAGLSFPASRFEREMRDLYGIEPVGHPAPRPLVRHAHWPSDWYPMRRDPGPRPPFVGTDRFPFLEVEGPGVYEIPVGPVHAGLIEPGHFRFSAVGETVVKLKPRLWFVHRGVEKLFEARLALDAVELAERISGDTSAGHALAHSLAVEDALGLRVPPLAQQLRALLVELERLYNHAGDLGALANDVGFSVANAHALRVREQLLRLNERVTGHRLLRGAIRPGAITLRALPDVTRLRALAADLADIARLTLSHGTVRERFTGTAVLGREAAQDLGCLGYVARASGLASDARIEQPYTDLPVRTVGATTGDVLARFAVRRDEFAASTELVADLVEQCSGPLEYRVAAPEAPHPSGSRAGIGIVEGWRGTIVHRVEVAADRRLTRAKIVDPSWFNWPALPVAMSDTIVPDFPLTNKSFNLSYAGNDL